MRTALTSTDEATVYSSIYLSLLMKKFSIFSSRPKLISVSNEMPVIKLGNVLTVAFRAFAAAHHTHKDRDDCF